MYSVEPLDPADPAIAATLLSLQRRAYRVEADLIGSDQIPQLWESLEELQGAALRWRGIRGEAGEVVAALAYTEGDGAIDIDRLVVDPSKFRNGYGATLVESIDDSAAITVSTGAANVPARCLYESLGFSWVRDQDVVPGLLISHFRRERRP